jgi:DNA-directed RNA polymerase subunit RPC12/RpoP
MRYRCTECDKTYSLFAQAARCHWGIGGVEDVDDRTHFQDGLTSYTLCGALVTSVIMNDRPATCPTCSDLHAAQGWTFPLPATVTA